MVYCINPQCSGDRRNPDERLDCQNCGTPLEIQNRYWLVRPLRDLDRIYSTEIFEVEDCNYELGDPKRRKILKLLKSSNSEWARLLREEAKVLNALSLQKYGGIPQVEPDGYFHIEIDNPAKTLQCLVMEFIEGQDLERWLIDQGNQPISERLARDWLYQIVATLERVHDLDLVHRDIKPSNIMLRHGQLVLIDFGIVKVEGRGLTRVGTPEYMAPEQAQGQRTTSAADFYALGLTFAHLLTGIEPTKLHNFEKRQKFWQDEAPRVSQDLKKLIDDMMNLDPKMRPQSAKQVLQRLVDLPQPRQRTRGWIEENFSVFLQRFHKPVLLLLVSLIPASDPIRNSAWNWIQSVLHPIPANHWKSVYFNNSILRGVPATPPVDVGVCNKPIQLVWGTEFPPGVSQDNFSAWITTKCYFPKGLYLLKAKADDAIKVNVDKQVVIDQLTNEQGCKEQENHNHADYFYSEGKEYPITIGYCEKGGYAQLLLEIKKHSFFEEPINFSKEWQASFYWWDKNRLFDKEQDKPFEEFYKQKTEKIGILNLGSNQRSDGKGGIKKLWQAGSPENDKRLSTDFILASMSTKAKFKAGRKYRVVVNAADDGFQLLVRDPKTAQLTFITPKSKWQVFSKKEIFLFEVPHDGTYDFYFLYYEREGHASIDFFWEEMIL